MSLLVISLCWPHTLFGCFEANAPVCRTFLPTMKIQKRNLYNLVNSVMLKSEESLFKWLIKAQVQNTMETIIIPR